MKNKTKKILAGLGICLTLAGGGLVMTGCNNMNVTQDQIDKIFTSLDNANQFMTDTKDLLAEQNELLEKNNELSVDDNLKLYFIKAMQNAANDTNLMMECSITNVDEIGNIDKSKATYKFYNDIENNVIKDLYEYDFGIIYRNFTLKDAGSTYDTTTYVNDKINNTKTYTISESYNFQANANVSEFIGFYNCSGLLNFIMGNVESGIMEIDPVSMEEIDNTIIFNCEFIHHINNSTGLGYVTFSFENEELVSFKYSVTLYNPGQYQASGAQILTEIEFTHDIDDFTFDTTGYVEA